MYFYYFSINENLCSVLVKYLLSGIAILWRAVGRHWLGVEFHMLQFVMLVDICGSGSETTWERNYRCWHSFAHTHTLTPTHIVHICVSTHIQTEINRNIVKKVIKELLINFADVLWQQLLISILLAARTTHDHNVLHRVAVYLGGKSHIIIRPPPLHLPKPKRIIAVISFDTISGTDESIHCSGSGE